jgi:hypothetical protein
MFLLGTKCPPGGLAKQVTKYGLTSTEFDSDKYLFSATEVMAFSLLKFINF